MREIKYPFRKGWRDGIRGLTNEALLDLYKQHTADSLNSVEFDALVFIRKTILNRMGTK